MKGKIIIIAALVAFSCQNDIVSDKSDWIQEIDKTILEYERTLKIESSKSFKENDIETTIEFYKENPKGLYKIKVTNYNIDFIDFSQEFYILNDDIVMNKLSGFHPLIYKRKRKETDPCCVVSERLVYFKNSDEVKAYIKKIKVMALNDDKKKFEKELKMLPFVEEEIIDVNNVYESAKQQLNWFKNKVK